MMVSRRRLDFIIDNKLFIPGMVSRARLYILICGKDEYAY